MDEIAMRVLNDDSEGDSELGNCAGDLDGVVGMDVEIDGGGVTAK